MRGEFCLAKTRSSVLGIPAAQTIEYKGFGGKKARKMGRRWILKRGGQKGLAANHYRNSL
jgi:hypothetical protein